ncbi:MAG: nucleotidyltransferase domain-containing protein [Nanoarchaeota archaeon]|nr:nucleotidyltransferase domain-containing protein [Nanoarchaeota archaeon]
MLEELKRCLTSNLKKKNIFDIVLYGSSVKGISVPRDIDILVIFNYGNLEERLNELQQIKFKLKKVSEKIDAKQILLQELFTSNFLARTGIILEGVSLSKEKKLSEIMGFKSYALFNYSIKKLNHTQKIKFNYVLAGRNQQGIIEKLNGTRIVNGAVEIPIENSLEFEDVLKMHHVEYNKETILKSM